jgi:tRNA(Ile)-lysidine synthase
MVLAEALHRLGIPFVALHFDHRWRGAGSRADAAFVAAWCAARGIRCRTGRAATKGRTTEGTAREQRWTFLLRSAKALKLEALLTAHHANDLAETLLIQLLRGAGAGGLASLRTERMREGVRVLRPLLDFSRSDLEQAARAWKLGWRDDPGNADPAHLRNRVRHRLLPYLEKLAQRPVTAQLSRTARILADENAWIETQVSTNYIKKLSLKSIKSLHLSLQRRTIHRWLVSHAISDIGFDLIESILEMAVQGGPAKVNLPGGRFCRRRAGTLWIE